MKFPNRGFIMKKQKNFPPGNLMSLLQVEVLQV